MYTCVGRLSAKWEVSSEFPNDMKNLLLTETLSKLLQTVKKKNDNDDNDCNKNNYDYFNPVIPKILSFSMNGICRMGIPFNELNYFLEKNKMYLVKVISQMEPREIANIIWSFAYRNYKWNDFDIRVKSSVLNRLLNTAKFMNVSKIIL